MNEVPAFDLTPNWATSPVFFLIIFLRYLFFAGGAYWVFYRWKRSEWWHKKIYPVWPKSKIVSREFKWSVITAIIFAVSGTAGLWAYVEGYTKIYLSIAEYGWVYFAFSIFLLMFLHEAYFYWTHRLLHIPWWFRHVHKIHHESVNPSPWAAFSFHPIEAVIQAIILPVLIFFVPVHPAALVIFLTVMTVTGVINHTGYEIYPKRLASHWLGKWIISATHHYQHHSKTHCNYGLYVTCWDRWLKTEDLSYEALYDEVKNREPKTRVEGLTA